MRKKAKRKQAKPSRGQTSLTPSSKPTKAKSSRRRAPGRPRSTEAAAPKPAPKLRAYLVRKRDDVEVDLPSSALVGRDDGCDVLLSDRRASADHARLRLANKVWTLRDLGSRNGTTVNGKLLEVGDHTVLSCGDTLEFGSVNESFIFAEDGPVVPLARKIADGTTARMIGDVLVLPPHSRSPQLSVLRRYDKQIVVEQEDGLRSVVDREVLRVNDECWQLRVRLGAIDRTEYNPLNVVTMVVHFAANRALDSVKITIAGGGQKATLGNRSFSWMLLLLALAYKNDTNSHDAAQRGWVDRDSLLADLNVTPENLNVLVNRARKKFALLDVSCAGQIVERDRGYLRIGVKAIQFNEYAAAVRTRLVAVRRGGSNA